MIRAALSSRSFHIFWQAAFWNKLLDLSIYYSFDKSGFLRHQKDFSDPLEFTNGANAIVTGGTSGIGLAVAKELANQQVNVWVTGRNPDKGNRVKAQNKNIEFAKLDMANWQGIEGLVNNLPELDYVVLNAGGMPETFQTNDKGVELQFASQLFGHYYLLKELQKQNKLKPNAKIVWVSSGGMYLSNINLEKIFKDDSYDKVATYANVKRAQVTLLPHFKTEFPEQITSAMHPGWVETPGVKSAIPKFERAMQGKLRTPDQGADTILWLLSNTGPKDSGHFYFDRKKVATHFFWFTKKSKKLKGSLIELLQKYI